MKYGANIVECQPSTPMATAKSHDTMLCTDTNTGSTSADSSIPAIACIRHCRGVPRQPRHSTEYIFGAYLPVALSRTTARSGMSATNTNSELPMRYVITALGSHTNGERTFMNIPREKSYGYTQNSRQGRPTWNMMLDSAATSENSVITSAARVTGRRHSACVRRSIAEIIIPAWLIPIQNTKFVM